MPLSSINSYFSFTCTTHKYVGLPTTTKDKKTAKPIGHA